MRFLSSYLDFLILESIKGKIYYSEEFRNLLKKMGNNDIAVALLSNEGSLEDNYTLVDITDKNDTISFTQVNRITRKYPNMDISKQKFIFNKNSTDDGSEFWEEGRTEMKIGRWARRVVKGVIIDVKDQQLEDFVNLYKSTFDGKNKPPFELVHGEEIRKYYFENLYSEKRGQLGNSCMRHFKCREYFDIYVENPNVCNLLILRDPDKPETILGRALIWKLTKKEEGSKYYKGEYYMDRIYTINDSDRNLFLDWAHERGMYTSADGWRPDYIMFVKVKEKKYKYYPYMDTFNMYNPDIGYLSNDDGLWPGKGYIKLEETDGSHIKDNVVWSEWHSEYIDKDEAVYCDNVEDWLWKEEACYLDYKDEWAADRGVVWSDYHQSHFYEEDVSYNQLVGDYLYPENENIIPVKINKNDIMYVPKERKDLYTIINDEYYSKLGYIIRDPYTNKYHFRDEEIDGKLYYNYIFSKICKDLLGKDISGIRDNNFTNDDVDKIRNELKNILLDYTPSPNGKIIKHIENTPYYKTIVEFWSKKFGMSNEPPKAEEFIPALSGWMISSEQYNPFISTSMSKFDQHLLNIEQILSGDTLKKYKLWRESVPYIWMPISKICYTFDYSLFPNEIWKRYLLLSL